MKTRTLKKAIQSSWLGLLGLAVLTANVHAATVDNGWRVSVPLYLTAGSYFHSNGVSTDTFHSVVASAEIVLSSPLHPYSAGFFVAHLYSRIGATTERHWQEACLSTGFATGTRRCMSSTSMRPTPAHCGSSQEEYVIDSRPGISWALNLSGHLEIPRP